MARELILLPKARFDVMSEAWKSKHNTDEDSDKQREMDSTSNTKGESSPLQPRSSLLFHYIKAKGEGLIYWDKDDIVYIRKKMIKGSNIHDLIQDAISGTRESPPPVGYKEFYNALKEMNTPAAFIYNKKRVLEHSEDTAPNSSKKKHATAGNVSPPGIRIIVKRKRKWARFDK